MAIIQIIIIGDFTNTNFGFTTIILESRLLIRELRLTSGWELGIPLITINNIIFIIIIIKFTNTILATIIIFTYTIIDTIIIIIGIFKSIYITYLSSRSEFLKGRRVE